MQKFHDVVLPRIARSFFKVRAAHAARLFFLIRPIKFFIWGVAIAMRVVGSKALYCF